MVSVRDNRLCKGHLLSSSRLKRNRQTRNKNSMHVFFKEFLFFHSFAALYLSSNLVSAWTKGGVFKQKADKRGQGGGRELKTG